jgi:hypothetical protein
MTSDSWRELTIKVPNRLRKIQLESFNKAAISDGRVDSDETNVGRSKSWLLSFTKTMNLGGVGLKA